MNKILLPKIKIHEKELNEHDKQSSDELKEIVLSQNMITSNPCGEIFTLKYNFRKIKHCYE